MTIRADGLSGKPLDEAVRVSDFTLCLCKRLTVLGDDDVGQVLGVGGQFLEEFGQEILTLLGDGGAPGLECLRGGLDGCAGLCLSHVGHGADLGLGGLV